MNGNADFFMPMGWWYTCDTGLTWTMYVFTTEDKDYDINEYYRNGPGMLAVSGPPLTFTAIPAKLATIVG